nr:ABC transporter ATP-binding protein [Clostridium sp. 19966]
MINLDNILEVKNLKTTFYNRGTEVQAVRGVSFHVENKEILGVVGESGSGKSVMMKSILGILPQSAKLEAGEILFENENILSLASKEKRKLKGNKISMIFQDPMTALNPLKKIGFHLEEVIRRHKNVSKKEGRKLAVEMLKSVGIPMAEKRLEQYPHEFSGGMRQRVLIAMALVSNPKLLIADEPTTALDVTIQAQILELLKKLKEEKDMSVVLITHDLGVVASLCTRIIVMYAGMIMEEGTVEEIFYSPKHPYTKALLNSIPKLDGDDDRLEPIKGTAPSLMEPPKGCPFAERCSFASEKCFSSMPENKKFTATHQSRCFLAEEGV